MSGESKGLAAKLIMPQMQRTKGGRALPSNTLFCIKMAPDLHQAGVACTQVSVGVQYSRMHKVGRPPKLPTLCGTSETQLHITAATYF